VHRDAEQAVREEAPGLRHRQPLRGEVEVGPQRQGHVEAAVDEEGDVVGVAERAELQGLLVEAAPAGPRVPVLDRHLASSAPQRGLEAEKEPRGVPVGDEEQPEGEGPQWPTSPVSGLEAEA
jgi:hypothetical protein